MKLRRPLSAVQGLKHAGFSQQAFDVNNGLLGACGVFPPDNVKAAVEKERAVGVMSRGFRIEVRRIVIQEPAYDILEVTRVVQRSQQAIPAGFKYVRTATEH